MAKMKKNINDAKAALDELLFASRDFTDEIAKSAKAYFGVSTQAKETLKAFRNLSTVTGNIAKDVEELLDGTKSLTEVEKTQNKILESRKKLSLELNQSLGSIKLSEEQITQFKNGQLDLDEALLEQSHLLADNQEKLLILYKEEFKVLNDLESEMSKMAESAKTTEENMGNMGTSLKGLGGILKKVGLGDLGDKMGIDDAVDSGRKLSASLGKGGNKAKVASHMIGKMGANLAKAFGPAALIAMAVNMIVKAFKQLDELSGETAKSMGISAAEGESLVKSMNQAANSSENLDFSTKDLVKSQIEMNQMLGTSVEFSKEMAQEFSLIQQRTGLSSDAMTHFTKSALKSGTSITDQLQVVSNVKEELVAQTGISMNLKDIQEGVASASKATLLSHKASNAELATLVFKARQYGLTMSQLDSTASSLLDFESSIAAELEAELLLGKNLNLEKARLAALNNDEATLSEEIAKNMGSAAEFGELNRIQQEALAKSVGMQREDLAAMLDKQKTMKALKNAQFKDMSAAQEEMNRLLDEGMTMEQAKIDMANRGLGDTLAGQLASQTRAEKMGKFQEKMGDLFMLLAEAFTPMIDELMVMMPGLLKGLQPIFKMLGVVLTISMKISMVFGMTIPLIKAIAATMTSIGNIFSPIVEMAKELFAIFEEKGLMAAWIGSGDKIKAMFKNVGKGIADYFLAPIRAAAGYVAGIGSFFGADLSTLSDFSKTTYSNPTPTTPTPMATGGIVTGPTNAMIGEGGEPEAVVPLSKANSIGFGGNSETNSLLKELISVAKSGGTVVLDGQKVGRALSLSNYSTQ